LSRSEDFETKWRISCNHSFRSETEAAQISYWEWDRNEKVSQDLENDSSDLKESISDETNSQLYEEKWS